MISETYFNLKMIIIKKWKWLTLKMPLILHCCKFHSRAQVCVPFYIQEPVFPPLTNLDVELHIVNCSETLISTSERQTQSERQPVSRRRLSAFSVLLFLEWVLGHGFLCMSLFISEHWTAVGNNELTLYGPGWERSLKSVVKQKNWKAVHMVLFHW